MKSLTRWAKTLLVIGVGTSMLLAGCGTNNNQKSNVSQEASNTSTSATGLEPYELTVVMLSSGEESKDWKEVQDEINKITREKINATVKFVPISFGAWNQQTTLMLSGNEKVDVILSGLGTYNQQVAKGQLLPLDKYIDQYGQGAKNALDNLDPIFLKGAQIDGKTFGIPDIKDLAANYGIVMRKDLVDKYKIDTSAIKSLDDLDAVFKIIKENEPGVAPVTHFVDSIIAAYADAYKDPLGDGFGVLLYNDNSLKVVNWYETPEYAELLNIVRRWYQAGYIDKDIATTTDSAENLVKANKAFSWLPPLKPGFEMQAALASGKEVVSVELKPANSTTTLVTSWMWSIANNSKSPERAMMFINLLYTDKELVNLYDWGIEGKHYVKKSDTIIDYPEGVNASNTGYHPGIGFMFGNQFLSYIWNGNDPELWTKMAKFNKESIKSKALGFSYNAESVKSEVAAVTNVQNQYKVALETGTIDPVKNLPDFIKQLKAAGIDKIIAEKQRQLDEWVKRQ